jgi:uncharacterized protein (DUF58 family)
MTLLAVALAFLALVIALAAAGLYLHDRRLKRLRASEVERLARKRRLDLLEESLTTISVREWR